MNASQSFTREAQPCHCRLDDSLQLVAQLLWERDGAVVFVVDADGHVVGAITHRHVLWAAYRHGKPLSEIPASAAVDGRPDESVSKHGRPKALSRIDVARRPAVGERPKAEVRSSVAKQDELSLILHDLRNPMSGTMLLAASLKREALSDRALELISRMERNIGRMVTLLDELVEKTRHEPGPAAYGVCSLGDVIAAVVERLDETRKSRVAFEVANGCSVFVDAVSIERAFTNLLDNALKYSDDTVHVRLDLRGGSAVVDVIDRGIGIAPENTSRLFDRNYRAPAGQKKAGGFGLGLYITRTIVESHGGRVEVRSTLGEGSTFSMVLPRLAKPCTPARAPDRLGLRLRRFFGSR